MGERSTHICTLDIPQGQSCLFRVLCVSSVVVKLLIDLMIDFTWWAAYAAIESFQHILQCMCITYKVCMGCVL